MLEPDNKFITLDIDEVINTTATIDIAVMLSTFAVCDPHVVQFVTTSLISFCIF